MIPLQLHSNPRSAPKLLCEQAEIELIRSEYPKQQSTPDLTVITVTPSAGVHKPYPGERNKKGSKAKTPTSGVLLLNSLYQTFLFIN